MLVEKGKTGKRGRRGVVTGGNPERGGEFREIGRGRRHGNGGKCRGVGSWDKLGRGVHRRKSENWGGRSTREVELRDEGRRSMKSG